MSERNGQDSNLPEPAGQPGDGSNANSQDDAGSDPVREDCMAPPKDPCECFCLHCGRSFMSDQMWFQRVTGARDGFNGFWMCPTPNCDGAGFTFDIFPTDPAHPANEGWHSFDDEEESEEEWSEDDEVDGPAEEWDPEEGKYTALDDWPDEEDDIEGEEWKLGLAPGERPPVQPPPPGVAPRTREEQDALYEQPDRRPRELDWSDREEPSPRKGDRKIYPIKRSPILTEPL